MNAPGAAEVPHVRGRVRSKFHQRVAVKRRFRTRRRAGHLLTLQLSLARGSPLKIPNSVRRITRALLALFILVWLARSVGFDLIRDQLTHANLLLLAVADRSAGARRCGESAQLAAAAQGERAGRARAIPPGAQLVFAGGFVGAIVPSSAGNGCVSCLDGDPGTRWPRGPVRGLDPHGELSWAGSPAASSDSSDAALLAYRDALPNLLQPAV